MPLSPVSVRRNQAHISAKHRRSKDAEYGTVISDHIDRQRRHVLELEAEALWLESEIRSLTSQCSELKKTIARETELLDANAVLSQEMKSVTTCLTLVCTAYMSGQKDSDMIVTTVSNRVRQPSPPDDILPVPAPLLDGQFTVVVDVPPANQSMGEYLKKLDDAVHDILNVTPRQVLLFNASQDQKELGALRVVFHLSHELAEKLSIHIEQLAESSANNYTANERFLMSVSRTFIFDGLEVTSAPSSPVGRAHGGNSPPRKFVTKQLSPKAKDLPVAAELSRALFESSAMPEKPVLAVKPNVSEDDPPPSPSVKDRISELERRNRRDADQSGSNSGKLTSRSSVAPSVSPAAPSVARGDRSPPSIDEPQPVQAITSEAKSGWGVKAPTPDRRNSISSDSNTLNNTLPASSIRAAQLTSQLTRSDTVMTLPPDETAQVVTSDPGSPSSATEKKEKKPSWFSRKK